MDQQNSFKNAKPYELPQLPYQLGDLAPVISEEIMTLHYTKHHQTYVNNFNAELKKLNEAQAENDPSKIAACLSALKFNGGGHINHSIFWTNLSPKNKFGGIAPEGELATAIDQQFGSLQNLIDQLSAKSIAIQGSGWGWLGFNPILNRLVIETCDNQDPLISKGLIPLLGIDVWEHAYYLQYKNVRADYVKGIWQIINWKNVAERFAEAKKK